MLSLGNMMTGLLAWSNWLNENNFEVTRGGDLSFKSIRFLNVVK